MKIKLTFEYEEQYLTTPRCRKLALSRGLQRLPSRKSLRIRHPLPVSSMMGSIFIANQVLMDISPKKFTRCVTTKTRCTNVLKDVIGLTMGKVLQHSMIWLNILAGQNG